MEGRKAVICFFVLFLTVYFLEAIGGFYMTSAVVSIEKQFQIPSRMSGLMVSAGDFGYIPSVVFVSYLGGKGNRARWIGGGCLMIALANFLISMSNFLFPVESIRLNGSVVEQRIEIDSERLSDDTTAESFFEYLSKSIAVTNFTDMIEMELSTKLRNVSMKEFAQKNLDFCYPKNESMNVCNRYFDYLREVKAPAASDIANIRILMGAPFAFCSRLVNGLRDQIEYLKCSKDPSNLGPFIMIFGGLLILGVGRTMPFSLGLPLIDDNVKRKNLPVYFAGMFFIRILGPVLGFMIGGITNRYYYSFEVPPGLSPRDPMWIGRWWAGFLGISIVMFGPSLALYLFPAPSKKKAIDGTAELENGDGVKTSLQAETGVEQQPLQKAKPTHKRNRSLALVDRNVTRDKDGNTVVPKNFDEKVNDFISTVKTIIRAPVYTGALIGRILDVLAFKGFFIFLPKYLEVQFGLPQHVISFYMGIVGVSGFAVGVLIGSVAMRKFKLQGRKAAAFVAVCSTMAAILSFLNAAVGCKSVLSYLADYSVANNGLFNSTCNEGCNCDGMPLYPVCNQLGEVFYSPCQAGCPLDGTLATDSPHKVFKKCACSNTTDMLVSRDFCHESVCESKFLIYFINMAISGVFGGMGVIPAVLIILRSVPPIDRSISLGFQGFLVSLFATLPSPVIWGWIVDSACIRWNNVCGDPTRGACSIYDTDRLRLRTHITYGIMRLISLVSDVWVFVFAKDLILIDEEPVPDENANEEEMQEITSDFIVDRDRKFSM